MLPTKSLFNAARVTLFTKPGCSLCDAAKITVSNVHNRRRFEYSVLDIMEPANKQWKDIYIYDIPVLHVQQAKDQPASDPKKLFHRFTEKQVEDLIDNVEGSIQ